MREAVDLNFRDFLEGLDDLGEGEWITVFSEREEGSQEKSISYCALLDQRNVEKSLSDPSWDLSISCGRPGLSFIYNGAGKETWTYSRWSDRGVEPLVIWRDFEGMKDGYWEVLEEFRHYFNLYEDHRNRKFIRIDDNGDDEDVVFISDNELKIKSRLIKEFLSVKCMCLTLFFNIDRFSEKTLDKLGAAEYDEQMSGDDFVYSIAIRVWDPIGEDKNQSFGRLMGKKLVRGPSDFTPKLFHKGERKYVEFIIGVNDNGNEVAYTCDEDKLANYYGKNRGAPNYLTPVLFRRDVLTKYYSQPDKYSVEDGLLRCGGLWNLRMDNNLPDYVAVFLGDLGHLSYKEQLHWRSFNVAAKGRISRTAWARGFEAKFAAPERSDLYFKQKFRVFQDEWEKRFGWKFFKPLTKEDEHYFKALRIPMTEEQKEFDEQVGALVKVFIDSLNERELEKGLKVRSGSRGIDKLEAFLESEGCRLPDMLKFMRSLQDLRSTAVAHRKGRKYEKVKATFSIGDKNLTEIFDDILVNCIKILNTLEYRFIKY